MSDLIPWLAPWSGRVVVLLSVLVGLSLVWRGLYRGKRKHPTCPRCEYNLTGASSTSCPECGHVSKREGDTLRRPRRYRLAMFGLIAAMVLPAFVVQYRIRDYGWGYYLRLEPFYSLSPKQLAYTSDLGHGLTLDTWWDRRAPYEVDSETLSLHGRRIPNYISFGEAWILMAAFTDGVPITGDIDLDSDKQVKLFLNSGYLMEEDRPGYRFSLHALTLRGNAGQLQIARNDELFGAFSLADRDGDGIPAEIHFAAPAYLDELERPGISREETFGIWLRHTSTGFVLDEQLCMEPLPDATTLLNTIVAIRDNNDPRSCYQAYADGLRLAFTLIYTGHAGEARELLQQMEQIAPSDDNEPDVENRVFRAIREAPFGDAILKLSETTTTVANDSSRRDAFAGTHKDEVH